MKLLKPPSRSVHLYPHVLRYPCVLSAKLDGIRALSYGKGLLSNSGEPIPNLAINEYFGNIAGLDGELCVGEPNDPLVMNRTSSLVRTIHGGLVDKKNHRCKYYVFDYYGEYGYKIRHKQAKAIVLDQKNKDIVMIKQHIVRSWEEVINFEEQYIEEGYEGVILRALNGRYKEGRATENEGIVYKLKRFEDAEGRIVEVLPAFENTSESYIAANGYAKKHKLAEDQRQLEMCGGFLCEFNNDIIKVAPGKFNHVEREKIWAMREEIQNKYWLKFKFFSYGSLNKPRHPVALGFRNKWDMS